MVVLSAVLAAIVLRWWVDGTPVPTILAASPR